MKQIDKIDIPFNCSACTFSQHSTCLSNFYEYWDWISPRPQCPPSCDSIDFHRSSTEYALLNLDNNKTSQRYSSMLWKMAEVPTMLMQEEPSYPSFSFFSDVGGSLGLILGFSLISALEYFFKLLQQIRPYVGKLFRGVVNKKKRTGINNGQILMDNYSFAI